MKNIKMNKSEEKTPYFTLSNGKKLGKSQFIRYFEKKVLYTLSKFELIKDYKKIAVACSGGKDSMALLYLMNNICKERRKELIAIMVDEGIKNDYRKEMIENVKEFCEENGIKLILLTFKKEFGFTLNEISKKIEKLEISNCYVCSILKRWLMNKKALQLKIEAIATAHSLDDEAESVMLNLLKGNPELLGKLGPISGITTKKDGGFCQRIKPFYLCSTKEIVAYCLALKIKIPEKKVATCPMRGETFRIEIRRWLEEMEVEKKHKEIKNALISSFLKMMPSLKEQYKFKEFSKCKSCGFPSSNEKCKTCEILEKLKGQK
jgi:uncharacterized protein (TIGR00269 family)